MKKILYFLLIGLLTACGTKKEEKASETLLKEYKHQLHDLNQKIAKLEKELNKNKKAELVNVKVSKIQTQLFEHFFDVTGSVEADQEVNVSPEGSGKIMSIWVKEGQRVRKGATLATLNTKAIDENIAEAKINLELATITFKRQLNLWNLKIGSEIQFLEAKSKKESLERTLEGLEAQKELSVIKSPVSGIIDVVYQKKGEIAGPQAPFAKVININKVKVYADVSESYLTKVKKGDQVTLSFPVISKEVTAPINMIGNYIDPNNRTFRIRVNLKNSDNLIKPNLLSVVKIRDYVAENAIIIPSLLIKKDFKGEYTFVADQKGKTAKAKKVYIKSGLSNNNLTEVTEGLKSGDLIISEGFNQIVEGSPIRF